MEKDLRTNQADPKIVVLTKRNKCISSVLQGTLLQEKMKIQRVIGFSKIALYSYQDDEGDSDDLDAGTISLSVDLEKLRKHDDLMNNFTESGMMNSF